MLFEIATTLELVATSALAGIIWLVQRVHYPALRDTGGTPEFYALNASRTTPVVAPLMLVEAAASAYLLIYHQNITHSVLFFLVVAIWILTFAVAVPLHRRLAERGYERPRLQRLVDRNRPRTILWSIRALALITIQLIPPELVP